MQAQMSSGKTQGVFAASRIVHQTIGIVAKPRWAGTAHSTVGQHSSRKRLGIIAAVVYQSSFGHSIKLHCPCFAQQISDEWSAGQVSPIPRPIFPTVPADQITPAQSLMPQSRACNPPSAYHSDGRTAASETRMGTPVSVSDDEIAVTSANGSVEEIKSIPVRSASA